VENAAHSIEVSSKAGATDGDSCRFTVRNDTGGTLDMRADSKELRDAILLMSFAPLV